MSCFHQYIRVPVIAALIILFSTIAAPAAGQNDVQIKLNRFGVGGVWRPGDIVAMQVEIRSALPDAINAWVHWEVPNADGDVGEYGRSIPLQQGRSRPTWLYAPIPPESRNELWSVRVFEEDDDGQRGRLITDARVGPLPINSGDSAQNDHRVSAIHVPISASLIGVVGTQQAGLAGLSLRDQSQIQPPINAIEPTEIVSRIQPDQLPDRWFGLRSFEAIIWTDESPDQLNDAAAEALVEYVNRGGHLIIVLQPALDLWSIGMTDRVSQDLQDILPIRTPDEDEEVLVRTLQPLLAKAGALNDNQLDTRVKIRTFGSIKDPDSLSSNNGYQPLIVIPEDGRVLAVQRPVGFGRVTVVGLGLGRFQDMLQADIFWNRILGRRADTPAPAELNVAKSSKMLATSFSPREITLGGGREVTSLIAHSAAASIGLLLAVVLFIGYWVVAGPGSFFALKAYKQVKHSWLAFFAASILFTAVAWLAVSASQSKRINVRHYTVLDEIEQSSPDDHPPLQRAATWISLYTPSYGDTPIHIAEDPEAAMRDFHNLLLPYYPANTPLQTFPNPDRFQVDVSRSFDGYAIPSRATTTQMYTHWMGEVSAKWGGLITGDIAVQMMGTTEESLTGTLAHKLPGTLRRVRLLWIKSSRLTERSYAIGDDGKPLSWVVPLRSGQLLNVGHAYSIAEWGPGQDNAFDLRQALADAPPGDYTMERYIERRYIDKFRSVMGTLRSGPEPEEMLEMLTIFQQLTPPKYLRLQPDGENPDSPVYLNRLAGRELDLSAWFTQPCVIITGFLDDVPCPLPIMVDGDDQPVESKGGVMIRWIYPLPMNTDIAFNRPARSDEN